MLANLGQLRCFLADGVAHVAHDAVHRAVRIALADLPLVLAELVLQRLLLLLQFGDQPVALGGGHVEGAVAGVQAALGLVEEGQGARSPEGGERSVEVHAGEHIGERLHIVRMGGHGVYGHRFAERLAHLPLDVLDDGGGVLRGLLVDLVQQHGGFHVLIEKLAQLADSAGVQRALLRVHHHHEVAAERQIALDGGVVGAYARVQAGHVHQHLAVALPQVLGMEPRLCVMRLELVVLQRLLLNGLELGKVHLPQQLVALAVDLDALIGGGGGRPNLRRQRRLRHNVRGQAAFVGALQPSVHQRGLAGVEGTDQRDQHFEFLDAGPVIGSRIEQRGVELHALADRAELVERGYEGVLRGHALVAPVLVKEIAFGTFAALMRPNRPSRGGLPLADSRLHAPNGAVASREGVGLEEAPAGPAQLLLACVCVGGGGEPDKPRLACGNPRTPATFNSASGCTIASNTRLSTHHLSAASATTISRISCAQVRRQECATRSRSVVAPQGLCDASRIGSRTTGARSAAKCWAGRARGRRAASLSRRGDG